MARDHAVITVQVLGARAAEWQLTRLGDRLRTRPLTICERLQRLRLELAALIDEARLRWHLQDGRRVDQTIAVTVTEAASS